MSSPARDLIATLSPPQHAAIQIIKLSLDCYNSHDGTGLFSGLARYGALAGRTELCAAQARDLPQFWALLLRRMQWPVPPKAADPLIVFALSAERPRAVLRVLATETASIITLARMLHDEDKATRKALRDELSALERAADPADPDFNDSLQGPL